MQDLDFQLIQKYSRPGPRYTSYPTALQFDDKVSTGELWLDSEKASGPLSLYFHLPFCESLCWFCACHTVISRDPCRADAYLDDIQKEIQLALEHIDRKRRVQQIHLGGGSPSFLSPEQIYRLGSIINTHFFLADDAECSVELDPRTLSRAKVKAFADIGFNRASFGVQDNHPAIQKRINRIQPHSLNVQTVEWLREAGFQSVNIDLVYGLPGQTTDSFAETLQSLLALKPDRFATFNYAHVPWMKPAQKNLLRDASIPPPETKFALLRLIIETLTQAGYAFIGMDHFALPGDELCKALENGTLQRNFQGYSTHAGSEILGLGISSISQSPHGYRQNLKSLKDYARALESGQSPVERGCLLSQDDLLRREVIMTLMCRFQIQFHHFEARYGIDFATYFKDALARLTDMEADGLLEIQSSALKVSPLGRLLIRNIAMAFDAYTQAAENRFSKTV